MPPTNEQLAAAAAAAAAKPAEPKFVPAGGPQPHEPRTDADLDRLSRVTPDDVENAVAFWDRHAPPGFRRLLRATPRRRPDPRGQ